MTHWCLVDREGGVLWVTAVGNCCRMPQLFQIGLKQLLEAKSRIGLRREIPLVVRGSLLQRLEGLSPVESSSALINFTPHS